MMLSGFTYGNDDQLTVEKNICGVYICKRFLLHNLMLKFAFFFIDAVMLSCGFCAITLMLSSVYRLYNGSNNDVVRVK